MNRYNNPFPYADDNKRYHTWNYYLKQRFGAKTAKVPLDGGFTCPNRDGTKGVGGCAFCSAAGSGDTIPLHAPLSVQFEQGLAVMRRKWPNCQAIAYFQAFTNTYGSLEKLHACFDPFVEKKDVCALAIATRADCLEQEVVDYLCELSKQKEIWVEIGLQSIFDDSAQRMNRGHTFAQFLACIHRLEQTPLKICVHLINSLPYETQEQMIESARVVGALPIHALKIHMLHLLKGTALADMYAKEPFPLLTMEEYVDTVIAQLEVLKPSLIIQRLTGDGLGEDLIAPLWTRKKIAVLNAIDQAMAKRNTWQGRCCSNPDQLVDKPYHETRKNS